MADGEPRVTIGQLDVQFEVHGDDREVFARLFDERFPGCIRRWWRAEQERKARAKQSGVDRALGDRDQAAPE
jgi:hypothetical protein